MNWKSVLLQTVLTAIVVLAGVRLLWTGNSRDLKELSDQYTTVQTRVDGMEKSLASLSKDVERALRMAESPPPRRKPPAPPSPMIDSQPRTPPQPGGPSASPPTRTTPAAPDDARNRSEKAPTAWMNKLSEEKKSQVVEAFKRHGDAFRAAISGSPKDVADDPRERRRIFEETNETLKEELKGILSPQEYEMFLSSLPQAPRLRPGAPQDKPPTP